MKKRIKILDIRFDRTTLCEASERIFTAIQNKGDVPFTVVTPNPIMVMTAREDKELFSALSSTDLSLADGIGVISAAKRLGTPLPERVTGIDTGYDVLKKLAEIGGSIYLLGAKPGVAKKAGMVIREHLPGLNIGGTHHGYFDDDVEIINDIVAKSPDLVAVCLGSPRQEIWVHQNKDKLSGVGAIICLGGALDVWSGCIKRAPSFFIKMRLEWLWRMLREPKRFAALPKMIKFRCLTRKTRQKADNIK
jgi:N-acetylglucosaminyldiphosphoundecaprenol N-acetyl-beta-D-mannosaminyltransferase